MAEFRLRIGFSKTGAAIWLSHLEVVRVMERCIRRSGLPYSISQGFSPHMKHTFSAALPVGTGSLGEYMDVEITESIRPEEALERLQAVQHELLPVLSVAYAAKDEPSLQLAYNFATYQIELEDPDGSVASELIKRLQRKPTIEVVKKGKSKSYDLTQYVVDANLDASTPAALLLSLVSRPEGSLRPEVILATVAGPDLSPVITSLMRVKIEQRDLG